MARTLAWRSDGRIFVSVHTASNPSRMDWSGYVRTALELSHRRDVRVYAVSYGGGPDGAQRTELAEALEGHPSPTVLLTGNRLVRALIGAFTWFNPNMSAVGLADHEAACRYLGLSPEESARAMALRRELELELGVGVGSQPESPTQQPG